MKLVCMSFSYFSSFAHETKTRFSRWGVSVVWTTQKHVPRWDLPAGLAGAQLGVKTPLPIHEGASRHTSTAGEEKT